MNELTELLAKYNSKNYTTLIKNRPALLSFLTDKYGTDMLIPEMLWCYTTSQSPTMCHCGNKAKFNTFNKGYRKVCSPGCKGAHHTNKMTEFWNNNPEVKVTMQAAKEKTNLEKYGNKNAALNETVKAKTKATNLKRYGAETPLASKIVQAKIKDTTRDKYGVDYPFQSLAIIKKGHNTTTERYGGLMTQARKASYEKYGGINPFASDEVKAKKVLTMQRKYNRTHALQSHLSQEIIKILENKNLFINKIKGLTIAEAAVSINVNEATIARRALQHDCKDQFAKSSRSKWEYKLTAFLLSLGLEENIDFVRGDRKILNGKELDFYFPVLNVAIEVGSLFWHSELNAGRTRQYHYNKWNDCKEKGITLIQYWDNEMLAHWNVIESKIRYLVKQVNNRVGARKISKIKTVDAATQKMFLNANHIQGQTNGSSLSLGAYLGDELVAVMLFVKRKNGTEITRYATLLDTVYSGLFSKMLKKGISELNLAPGTKIISYSDNRHSNGNVYSVNKFTQINTPRSAYWYTSNYHSLENQKKFSKSKIASKFDFDMSNKTEWEAMQELGYDRVWDAGKIKWEMIVGLLNSF